MLQPTCRALCCRGAGCLSGVGTHLPGTVGQGCRPLSSVRTYLPGTVLQWCRMFKRCQNLPSGHCVAGVQVVKAVSEPTCRALCCRGAGCLSSVGTYLPGTVLQGCSMFKRCCNLSAGTVLQGCRMFKQCRNLAASTVLQGCRMLKRCQNLTAGHCVAGCLSGVRTYLP